MTYNVFNGTLNPTQSIIPGETASAGGIIGLRADAEGERTTAHGEGQSSDDGRTTAGRDASPPRRLRPRDDHIAVVPSLSRRHVARTCFVS